MNQERKVNKIDEIWKDVKDYKGLYKVSNFGRVKSLKRINCYGRIINEKILTSTLNNKGYLRVKLSKNGKGKNVSVHRLVAEAFIPNPNNLPQINHKDENPKNNNVKNLEWCDNKYNSNFGTKPIRIGRQHKKKIGQYTKENKLIKIWDSATDVKKELNYDDSSIRKCCNNIKNYNTAYGFI